MQPLQVSEADRGLISSILTVDNKIVNFRGQPFVSNIKKKAPKGALECAIEYAASKGHQVVLAVDLGGEAKMYGSFPDVDVWIASGPLQHHFYEVLWHEVAWFFFLDLEWLLAQHQDEEAVVRRHIQRVYDFVEETFGEALERTAQVSTATGPTFSVVKTQDNKRKKVTWTKASWHIKFPFAFPDQPSAKAFATRLHSSIQQQQPEGFMWTKPGEPAAEPIMDGNPYSRNQLMRALYSSKKAAPERRLMPALDSSEDLRDHLVTVHSGSDVIMLPRLEAAKKPRAPPSGGPSTSAAQAAAAPAPAPAAAKPVPRELLRVLVLNLSSQRAHDYHTWVRVCWAIVNVATEGDYKEEARHIWHQFSQLSAKYDSAEVDACFDRAADRPDGVGLGSIKEWLRQDDPELYSHLARSIYLVHFGGAPNNKRQHFLPNLSTPRKAAWTYVEYAERWACPYNLLQHDYVVIRSATGSGGCHKHCEHHNAPC